MNRNIFVFVVFFLLVGIVSAETVDMFWLTEDSADEYMYRGTNKTYSDIHDGAGTASGDGTCGAYYVAITSETVSGYYYLLYRLGYGFNTSSIDDDGTVTAVRFGYWGGVKSTQLGTQYLGITGFTPTTANNFAAGDYNKFTNTRYATDVALATGSYTNVTWWANATSQINKTGYTNFMLRLNSDIDNSAATLTWDGPYKNTGLTIYDYQESAGKYPFLEVTWTAAAGGDPPVASFTSDKTSGAEPLAVQFNDTSTNTPTSWNWSFNNVTGNNTEIWWSTTRNATQTFGIGNHSIVLNASNAEGYNITPGLYWVNVTAPSESILIKIIRYLWQFRLPAQLVINA